MKVFPNRRTFIGMAASALGWFGLPVMAQTSSGGQGQAEGRGRGKRRDADEYVLPSALSAFNLLSLVLGRVSDRSVTISALGREAMEGYFEYGTASGKYSRKSKMLALAAGEPVEAVFDDLRPSTQYFYRTLVRKGSAAQFQPRPECRFHTQRAAGVEFKFAIQGDSHPERPQMSDPRLYART